MSANGSELDMIARHVREGAKHIASQRALIARRREHDLPTGEAEALLGTFQDLQRRHEAHLANAEAKRSPGWAAARGLRAADLIDAAA